MIGRSWLGGKGDVYSVSITFGVKIMRIPTETAGSSLLVLVHAMTVDVMYRPLASATGHHGSDWFRWIYVR